MEILTGRLARIIFAVPFGMFGIFHLMNSDNMAAMVLDGWPLAKYLVLLTGLCLIAASVSIISGKMAMLASLLLALLLLIFDLTLHVPRIMAAEDEMSRMVPMIGFLKDTALMGGALVLAGVFSKQK